MCAEEMEAHDHCGFLHRGEIQQYRADRQSSLWVKPSLDTKAVFAPMRIDTPGGYGIPSEQDTGSTALTNNQSERVRHTEVATKTEVVAKSPRQQQADHGRSPYWETPSHRVGNSIEDRQMLG
jgi:hypothetical protein